MFKGRWSWIFDFLLIAFIAGLLIRPWWKLKYHDNWPSIESTFIADARILKDHWPRPLWNPFWYTGTRSDYIYPPALRYGTAALAKYYPMTTVKAYHLYTGFFYCIGIAGVYLLARLGFRRRGMGYAAAFGAAVVSPGYLFIPEVAIDGFGFGTSKLNALVRYGEGPHMTALAWIPLALAFSWLSLCKRSWPWAMAGAIACAMVVANNFYGATALAIFFPLLVWAIWVTERDWRLLPYAAAIPAVAYGLCAPWLTVSYLKLTLRNMQYVSSEGNLWSGTIAVLVLVAFLATTDRRYRGQRQRAWELFVVGSALFFVLNTVGNRWMNFRVIGEPARMIPELDIVLIFGTLAVALWLWGKGRAARVAVVLAAMAIVGIHHNYLWRHRSIFPARVDAEPTVYYQIPAWIAAHHPEARSYLTGGVRFWFNTWHDLYQMGGSSEQGLQNQMVMPSQWEINLGEDPQLSIAWFQLLGVDLVAVHGPQSEESYKDFQYPKKFDGVLPVVYDDGKDNRIFEVPRRYRSLARVVERSALDAAPQFVGQTDLEALQKYVALLEQGPEAAVSTKWKGTEDLEVQTETGVNQAVVVQVTYDECWRAESNLGRLHIEKIGALGFMRIDTPPGVTEIRLRFHKPREKKVGEGLFGLTLLGMGWTLWRHRANKKSSALA